MTKLDIALYQAQRSMEENIPDEEDEIDLSEGPVGGVRSNPFLYFQFIYEGNCI